MDWSELIPFLKKAIDEWNEIREDKILTVEEVIDGSHFLSKEVVRLLGLLDKKIADV